MRLRRRSKNDARRVDSIVAHVLLLALRVIFIDADWHKRDGEIGVISKWRFIEDTRVFGA